MISGFLFLLWKSILFMKKDTSTNIKKTFCISTYYDKQRNSDISLDRISHSPRTLASALKRDKPAGAFEFLEVKKKKKRKHYKWHSAALYCYKYVVCRRSFVHMLCNHYGELLAGYVREVAVALFEIAAPLSTSYDC